MEMEDLYSIHPGIARGAAAALHHGDSAGDQEGDLSLSEALKAQIASHPRYPSLLSAYVQCRKVPIQYIYLPFLSFFLSVSIHLSLR